MEAIGGVSGVLQLVQAVGVLANGVVTACQRLCDAPTEFSDIGCQASWISSHLQNVGDSLKSGPPWLSPEIERCLFGTLTDARTCLVGLESKLSRASDLSKIHGRVKWAACDRNRAFKLLRELEIQRDRIHSSMQMLGHRASSSIYAEIQAIKIGNEDMNQKLAEFLRSNGPLSANLSEGSSRASIQSRDSNAVQRGRNVKQRPERRLRADPWNLGRAWAALGVHGRGVPTSQAHWEDHHMTFAFSAPLTQFIGNYELGVSVNVRRYNTDPWRFQILQGSGFDISRIVSSSHPFLDACHRGDVRDIRGHLLSGQGRLSDRDDQNWTPLAHAISSGSSDAVEELLNHGADVEGTVGQLQTTPLQWALWHKSLDITRLLLRRQASQDRMNTRGWNTVFFLWARLRAGEPCMMEFLNLLADDSYLDLDIADALNWTVLDRVAAVGTAKEIRRLIELGANPYQAAEPLCWTAIHQAVFHGNFATFEELIPEYGETANIMVDDRGWTLLHIAASAGHNDIVRHLLKIGADPCAKSKPYESHMPEILHNMRCTPQEVAAAQSREREKAFMDALHDHHLSTGYVVVQLDPGSDSDSELEEKFCEAREYAG